MGELKGAVEAKEISIPVGIVVERRTSGHPWADDVWMPVAAIAGAPANAEWTKMVEGEGWTRYLAATLPVDLHHKETDGYVFNLQSAAPSLFVVLRKTDDGPMPVAVHLVTASPHEADGHLQSDDEIVEKVAMPEEILRWVEAFVARHHVEVPFVKRRKNRIHKEDHLFGKEPIFRRSGPGSGEADR
jgi:hypothetical protein